MPPNPQVPSEEVPRSSLERAPGAGNAPRICAALPRYFPHFGGHIIQTQRFIPILRRLGPSTFVFTSPVAGHPDFEDMEGVEVRRARSTLLPVVTRELLSLAPRYDVLHVVGNSWFASACLVAARLSRKPVVTELVQQGGDDFQSLLRMKLGGLRLALAKTVDRVVCLSPALVESTRAVGVSDEKIVQIPVGVDTELFAPVQGPEERSGLRQRLGLPPDGFLVLNIGEIVPRKGFDVLVDAWPAVVRAAPDAYLVVVGPHDQTEDARRYLAEQRAKIAAAGLESRIHLTGRVDNAYDYMRAADVFTLPSTHEGLPNAALEAMACAVPLIISDMPGISRSLVRSPDEGFVVEERTGSAWARAIVDLLGDPDRRARIGRNGVDRIAEEYSIEHRARLFDRLYRSLAG
jgi:glycosyltransferase involved in cell wall biosynthesis